MILQVMRFFPTLDEMKSKSNRVYSYIEKLYIKLVTVIRLDSAKSSLRSDRQYFQSPRLFKRFREDREQNGATFLAQARSFFPPRVIHTSARVPRVG